MIARWLHAMTDEGFTLRAFWHGLWFGGGV